MILFLLSLLAGGLTVLAPCTIALLPVIVGGSIDGKHSYKRALVVTGSLGVSVIVFTLLLKVSSSLIAVPQEFWQWVSGGIILALGLTMLFPVLWESISFVGLLNRGSNRLLATGFQKQSFFGDVLVGSALGPVFSSCSPTYFLILATVLPRSLTEGLIYLLAYTVGLCGGLFAVTLASQKILQKLGLASDPKGWIKRSISVLFILLGMTIILGYEKKLELIVANNVFDVTKIEQHILRTQEENNIQEPSVEEKSIESVPSTTIDVEEKDVTMSKEKEEISVQTPGADERMSTKAKTYTRAPEITNPSGFVNTDGKPITLSEFKGKKVVLVDFWTYSCINCQRTIPYLKAWDEKYRDEGLVIVGVHTPEFAFEKVLKNVENSVNNTFDLKYPVVLDNEYNTWNAFGNRFWPRKYLIDIDGYIVYDHIGEGAYDITEKEIQKALKERAEVLNTNSVSTGIVNPSDVVKPESGKVGSPEVYFGSDRNDSLGNGTAGVKTFIVPQSISKNTLYLDGTWNRQSEYAESKAERVKIIYKYSAKDVYFVASSDAGATIKVSIDGKPAGAYAGSDVSGDGSATITENRLYKLIQDTEYGEHTLEIEVIDGTLQAYTFTFG